MKVFCRICQNTLGTDGRHIVPITLAIILGLLVMAFGSLKDSLIIFTGVPLALTGGVMALWLRDLPLSIYGTQTTLHTTSKTPGWN